jgi:hypothetical protein
MNTKNIFTSKTMAAQAITAAAALIPQVREFVAAHPGETLVILSLVNAGLRWITKGRVALFT